MPDATAAWHPPAEAIEENGLTFFPSEIPSVSRRAPQNVLFLQPVSHNLFLTLPTGAQHDLSNGKIEELKRTQYSVPG